MKHNGNNSTLRNKFLPELSNPNLQHSHVEQHHWNSLIQAQADTSRRRSHSVQAPRELACSLEQGCKAPALVEPWQEDMPVDRKMINGDIALM
jgi:hypothetical protein